MRCAAALLLLGACLLAVFVADGRADDARPAALTIRERKPGTFDLRWQTPLRGGARLRAAPRLPAETVQVDGTYDRRVTGDALVESWRFTLRGGLEGRSVAIDGLAMARRGAILTIELASGALHRAVLSGARVTFDVPEPLAATRTRWFEAAPGWVGRGARDGLGWIHLAFALAIALAGGWRGLAFALGAFLVADVVGRVVPWTVPSSPGIALVALAGALAAREAALGSRRRLPLLAALAGLAHGLAMPAAPVGEAIASALGLDAVHVAVGLGALAVLALLRSAHARRPAGFALGVLGVALAIGTALEAPARAAPAARAQATLPMAMLGDAPPTPARTSVDGLEFYLDVSVFQTRVEMQARLPALVDWLGLGVPDDPVPVDEQDALLERVTQAVRDRLTLTIDGAEAQPSLARRGFTRRDAVGAYLRTDAVPEAVADAVIGLVFTAPTRAIPKDARLDVRGLPYDTPLRARVLDPEVSREVLLTPELPRLEWTNALEADPLPPIRSVSVRTEAFVLPVIGGALAVLAVIACTVLLRRRKRMAAVVLRVGLTAALVAMPMGTLSLPALGESRPELTDAEARAIVGTLLDNLYRSFNERAEQEVYDGLALSLSGDELEKAYLANRAALAVEEVGLSVHVDVVELRALEDLVPMEDGSFEAQASWTVAGSVTHFGHRHLRQNLYGARLVVRPAEGTWKIDTLELRRLERTR